MVTFHSKLLVYHPVRSRRGSCVEKKHDKNDPVIPYIIWLVVETTPLKNIEGSWDMLGLYIVPNICKQKQIFQTTKQSFVLLWRLRLIDVHLLEQQ